MICYSDLSSNDVINAYLIDSYILFKSYESISICFEMYHKEKRNLDCISRQLMPLWYLNCKLSF